ncbi:hypothetical protein WJX79_004139 [Trebouxia sp. C0005]
MVWSNIPGANIHRGAEGDNTLQRAEQAGSKRNTYPSSQSTLMQSRQPSQTQPVAVAHRSSRIDNLSCSAQFLGEDNPGTLKTKVIGDNTTVRFNNHYCPELGAAMALARQEVYGSHPVYGTSDLISSRPAAEVFETFTDVPRLVDTLSLLRRQAPSAPLHHFQHGFGSLRTVRPNMTNPAPGWYYYGGNKAAGTTAGVGGEPPLLRHASCCAAAHPHDQDKAVQIGTPPASKADITKGIARAQEQVPIKAPTGSCLDTATMLQLLQQQQQQQQHESQAQGSADQADRVSVGCQTRQGDTWRMHSEACQGKPAEESGSWAQHDKAWVPAGTHYLDKQAHEALTPKHPPNSPQGNMYSSPPSSRRHRSPNSTSRRGRAAAKSPMRPPWDTWGSPGKASRGDQSSPCQSPTRAELKKMTASWSPGRKGFVKPELAQAQENRFSRTQGSLAEAKRQTRKPRKKQSSPKKASAQKEALYQSGDSSQLSAQPSESGSELSCSVSEASQCSQLGQEEERSWTASSIKAESGVTTHKPHGGQRQGGGKAGSLSSSGLRHEVQDSLSELERLIEQQHRQLIARGILLPEEPSCDSVAASDLDFSNLSLDSGMDRLSRLADSLVEGMTPSSCGAHSQDTKAGNRSLGIASRDGGADITAPSMVQPTTAANSAETRGSQDDRSAAAAAAHAGMLRPTNTSQAAARESATAQSKGVGPPGAFSAHCTVTVAPPLVKGNYYGDGAQETAFSAIFRQTPTDSMAEEAESETWEDGMVDEGGSEYSGGLSGEPSAAHWAEQQDACGPMV